MPFRSILSSRFVPLFLAALLAASRPDVAWADGVADEAEVNFRLGAERYQAGDYRAALAYFLASNRLSPNRHVRFNVARTFLRLSQFPEAYRWYQDSLEGESDPAVRTQIEDALRTIEREVAILDVRTTPAGATVFLDRRDLGSVATTPSRIAVPAGSYRVLVHLDGYEEIVAEGIEAARGSVVPLAFELRRIVGTVAVEADGPTAVRVDAEDAEPACTAPCRLDLPPGDHVLFFERPGFRAAPRQVHVEARQVSTVRVDASSLTGSIVVTAAESDALVEVDGVAMGFTPVVVPNVPVGTRRVRISLRGFEPVEREVVVREDTQADLRDVLLVPTRQVTTASRMAQTIDDAPASVSVVSVQELEAFRYPTIYEALRGQRGLALSYDGAYSNIAIRGLGQPSDYSNRMLVLTDGATLNDNIVWQAYTGYDGRVDLGDVERIELVRGPGSVLYGTGAVTGVVNLIPHASPDRTGGEVRIAANDTNTARARGAVDVRLGERGRLAISASGAHSSGQPMSVPTVPTPTLANGVNHFDAATGNLRLELGDFRLQAFYTYRDQKTPNGAYGSVIDDPRPALVDQRALFEARYEPALSEKVRLYTRAFANLYRFGGTYVYADSTGGESVVDETYQGTWFGVEARVVAQLVESLRLSAGGEVQVDTRAYLRGTSDDGTTSDTYLSSNHPYQIYAGYALVEWAPGRAFTLSAGARLDAWSTFGATVNPRVVILFRPTSNDVLKLMGGRAFRAPSIYELYYNDGGATQVASDYDGNQLKPEIVWSAELEYTHRFGDGWSLLGAVHTQYAKDFIETASTAPGDPDAPFYYRNGGSPVYTLGGDVEAKREFRAGWMVSAMYGYLLASYVDASYGGGNRRVPNAPRQFASFRGIAPLGPTGLRLAVRLTLEAPRRINVDTNAQTPTAVVGDVVLSGEVSRWGLDYAFGVYNVFGWPYALPTDPTFQSTTMPQPGRTFLASLGLRF
ncbi:MAG: TonB-dependent receptor [Polyangiales bacterium]